MKEKTGVSTTLLHDTGIVWSSGEDMGCLETGIQYTSLFSPSWSALLFWSIR
jgi:hypothetical protein